MNNQSKPMYCRRCQSNGPQDPKDFNFDWITCFKCAAAPQPPALGGEPEVDAVYAMVAASDNARRTSPENVADVLLAISQLKQPADNAAVPVLYVRQQDLDWAQKAKAEISMGARYAPLNEYTVGLIDRAHLAPLQAENRQLRQFKTALSEWADKTEWLRITIQPKELGMHLADVMKGRVDQLNITNELLRDRKNSIVMLKRERDQLEGLLRECGPAPDQAAGGAFKEHRVVRDRVRAALSRPDTSTDVEPPEATDDYHDDDLGDGEAERMQRKAKNESTAYDGFDNGVD